VGGKAGGGGGGKWLYVIEEIGEIGYFESGVIELVALLWTVKESVPMSRDAARKSARATFLERAGKTAAPRFVPAARTYR
jgi:hypothetical protein